MWRESIIADPRLEFLDYMPNQLLGHSVAPRLADAANLSEKLSCLNARRQYECITKDGRRFAAKGLLPVAT